MPVSIIDKPLPDRMASTIHHNRARGTHDVDLMSNIEDMKMVIKRFLATAMTMEEVSVKMDASVEDLTKLLNS